MNEGLIVWGVDSIPMELITPSNPRNVIWQIYRINRPESTPFHDLGANYFHQPNGREGNVMKNGVRNSPDRADNTRLTGKVAHNKPVQKMVSEKKGVF